MQLHIRNPEWLVTQSGWTPRVAGHPEWLVTQSGWSPRVAGHPEWLVTQSGWTSHSSDTMQRSTPALSVPVKVFDKATQKLDDVHSFMKSCLYVSRRHNDMWTIVWEYSDLEPGRYGLQGAPSVLDMVSLTHSPCSSLYQGTMMGGPTVNVVHCTRGL